MADSPLPAAPGEDFDDCETPPSPELRALTVDAALHGERLDKALVRLIPEFSRSYLQQLVDAGAAQLNGAVLRKPAQRVKAGDRIDLEMRPTLESQAFRPENLALDVVYEDAHLLVVNKPAGLVVHPAPGNWRGTLLNALLGRDPSAAAVPRAGIVHRLDKDTSGLMVVARTRAAMDALVHLIAARQVHRHYLAMAHGQWPGPPAREVAAPVGRDPRNRLRMAVVDLAQHAGKAARTDLYLVSQGPAHCLVRCVLHTGRTHQIRVHMAHIGLPLVGDVLYGGRVECGLVRQALHAHSLSFAHPFGGQPLSFNAALPQDIVRALEYAGVPTT